MKLAIAIIGPIARPTRAIGHEKIKAKTRPHKKAAVASIIAAIPSELAPFKSCTSLASVAVITPDALLRSSCQPIFLRKTD